MSVILLTRDLMATSWARGAAGSSAALEVVASAESCLAKAGESAPALVILDLGSISGDALALLVSALKAGPSPPRVVAFGPHVQEARLADAMTAGCDEVMSRGQFHAQVGQWLARASER